MKQLIFSVILVVIVGCKNDFISSVGTDYVNDSTLSSIEGTIKDSSRFFLPSALMKSSFMGEEPRIDTFRLTWFSRAYLCFHEPILYNYYLGCENYRLLWLRSFNRSVIISIKKSKKIIINTKILKRQPIIFSTVYRDGYRYCETFDRDIKKLRLEFPDADSIVVPKFDDKIILDETDTISKKEWNRFKFLLDSCSFWHLKPTDDRFGLDGSDWTLEGQSSNKYHFVFRWSPEDAFEKCCEYLIKLSSAKNEEIY